MKRFFGIGLTLVLVTMVSVVAFAQVKQGKTRPMKTKHLMKGLNGPCCGGIGEGLKAGPADDKAWDDLIMKAALLNESSYILMEDGRCPDGEWAKAATTLREESAYLAGQARGQGQRRCPSSIRRNDSGLRRMPQSARKIASCANGFRR